MNKSVFGLVGYPLSHSFSQRYFTQKFISLGLLGYRYELFEIKKIEEILQIADETPLLQGVNVTTPYKQSVIPLLDYIDPVAKLINSVNTIRIKNKKLYGYNTDYLGFEYSLKQNLKGIHIKQVAILGTGGAAQSVGYALKTMSIPYFFVSRQKDGENTILYDTLNNMNFNNITLFVNATPCGMFSSENPIPDININKLNRQHIVFDLIYNPSPTQLLTLAHKQGAKVVDGLQMLFAQADYSWQIWNK